MKSFVYVGMGGGVRGGVRSLRLRELSESYRKLREVTGI